MLAQLQEAHKSRKGRRKMQIFFFFLRLIHSWRAVRSQRIGEQVFIVQLTFSEICSVGGGFQCKMLFLPNIADLYIFTSGKQSAWFFTAAFWKVLDNFTFASIRSIKVEIWGRLLYCCSKVGGLNTLMSPTCGKLANRKVEAENWRGEELACWTSGGLLWSVISPV